MQANKTLACKKHLQRVSPDFSALINNVDQLTNKLNELKIVVYSKNYDLVLLTKVCPKSSKWGKIITMKSLQRLKINYKISKNNYIQTSSPSLQMIARETPKFSGTMYPAKIIVDIQ